MTTCPIRIKSGDQPAANMRCSFLSRASLSTTSQDLQCMVLAENMHIKHGLVSGAEMSRLSVETLLNIPTMKSSMMESRRNRRSMSWHPTRCATSAMQDVTRNRVRHGATRPCRPTWPSLQPTKQHLREGFGPCLAPRRIRPHWAKRLLWPPTAKSVKGNSMPAEAEDSFSSCLVPGLLH